MCFLPFVVQECRLSKVEIYLNKIILKICVLFETGVLLFHQTAKAGLVIKITKSGGSRYFLTILILKSWHKSH